MNLRDEIYFLIGAVVGAVGMFGVMSTARGGDMSAASPLTPPASQKDVELCERLHQFLSDTNQHDGEVVRYKRNDGTQIDCGMTIKSIPKIEVRT